MLCNILYFVLMYCILTSFLYCNICVGTSVGISSVSIGSAKNMYIVSAMQV